MQRLKRSRERTKKICGEESIMVVNQKYRKGSKANES